MRTLTKHQEKALIKHIRKTLKAYSDFTIKPKYINNGICRNLSSSVKNYVHLNLYVPTPDMYNNSNVYCHLSGMAKVMYEYNKEFYTNHKLYFIKHPQIEEDLAYSYGVGGNCSMWHLSGTGISKDTKEYNRRRRLAAKILSKAKITITSESVSRSLLHITINFKSKSKLQQTT